MSTSGYSGGEPQKRFKFELGDIVRYVNDQGVDLGERIITGRAYEEVRGPCYAIRPTDTEWYRVKERNLTFLRKASKDDFINTSRGKVSKHDPSCMGAFERAKPGRGRTTHHDD
jgi:hypothetical protein